MCLISFKTRISETAAGKEKVGCFVFLFCFVFKLRSLKISSIQIWQTLKTHSISDKLGISNYQEAYDSDPSLPLICMKKNIHQPLFQDFIHNSL